MVPGFNTKTLQNIFWKMYCLFCCHCLQSICTFLESRVQQEGG